MSYCAIKVLQRAGHGNQLGIRADENPMSSAFCPVRVKQPHSMVPMWILYIPPSDVAK